jgi:hypothetical protein
MKQLWKMDVKINIVQEMERQVTWHRVRFQGDIC